VRGIYKNVTRWLNGWRFILRKQPPAMPVAACAKEMLPMRIGSIFDAMYGKVRSIPLINIRNG